MSASGSSRQRHRRLACSYDPSDWHTSRLRAAILGANDGLVSTASLMVGVAGSGASSAAVVTAGIAGVAAGSLAMAAGEYVSVSSQRDVETADRTKEQHELRVSPDAEQRELVGSYMARGLDEEVATRVAEALHRTDPLAAHLRDELGHGEHTEARPLQAAAASATSFLLGGIVPFLGLLATSRDSRTVAIVLVTLVGLAASGYLGARAAGGGILRPTFRVLLGGAVAMAITAGVGSIAQVSGV